MSIRNLFNLFKRDKDEFLISPEFLLKLAREGMCSMVDDGKVVGICFTPAYLEEKLSKAGVSLTLRDLDGNKVALHDV